jgi:hypothetical protein
VGQGWLHDQAILYDLDLHLSIDQRDLLQLGNECVLWRDGGPIECTAGLETELDAIEEASSLAEHYDGLEFVITQGRERPTP